MLALPGVLPSEATRPIELAMIEFAPAPVFLYLWRYDERGAAPMSMNISHETEARLTDEAQRQGISVEALLERLMSERGVIARVASPAPELPVWHLGVVGPLHRRDIYDDVR
jgi:hypothetical protein